MCQILGCHPRFFSFSFPPLAFDDSAKRRGEGGKRQPLLFLPFSFPHCILSPGEKKKKVFPTGGEWGKKYSPSSSGGGAHEEEEKFSIWAKEEEEEEERKGREFVGRRRRKKSFSSLLLFFVLHRRNKRPNERRNGTLLLLLLLPLPKTESVTSTPSQKRIRKRERWKNSILPYVRNILLRVAVVLFPQIKLIAVQRQREHCSLLAFSSFLLVSAPCKSPLSPPLPSFPREYIFFASYAVQCTLPVRYGETKRSSSCTHCAQ